MENKKEELLAILRDIFSSSFFTTKEKEEVLYLFKKGNRKIDELAGLLRKYLVAKTALGIKGKGN